MLRLATTICLLLITNNTFAQVLYVNSCKQPCQECLKQEKPQKVTYKADPKTNSVLRVFEGDNLNTTLHNLDNCKIQNKDNWVCSTTHVDKFTSPESGKQFAINGVAYWNDSEYSPEFTRKFLSQYSCRYEKNMFGSYKVIRQTKNY
jgi:hypothetical protein